VGTGNIEFPLRGVGTLGKRTVQQVAPTDSNLAPALVRVDWLLPRPGFLGVTRPLACFIFLYDEAVVRAFCVGV